MKTRTMSEQVERIIKATNVCAMLYLNFFMNAEKFFQLLDSHDKLDPVVIEAHKRTLLLSSKASRLQIGMCRVAAKMMAAHPSYAHHLNSMDTCDYPRERSREILKKMRLVYQ
jgi:hypothetical protein